MTDPLTAAIEAAVERALDRKLPALFEKHTPPPPTPRPLAPPTEGERFVTLREAGARLRCHRTTLLRMEKDGRIPPRRRLGQRTGWLQSEVEAFLGSLAHAIKGRAA